MDTDDNYLADTEDHLHPIWLSLSRDFEDRRAGEAQTCNQLLTQHLHCSVGAWNCDDGGWTFQLPYMTIRVHHDESGPLAAAAESDVMPRRYLDGLRWSSEHCCASQTSLSIVRLG